jgi:N-acetylmuramoyl-L-alanine amidase
MNYKQLFRRYLSSLLLIGVAATLMSFTVVIDAGHGGHDTGAVGLKMKVQEKDLNLTVAKQLAAKIQTAYPEVTVVLTRDTDVFLPLQKRADIANKNHADLFISIHTNAAENRNAQGAETFILGTERMEDNLDVAMRENAVMKLEEDQTVYQGFDPNSIESYILFELMQNQYMDHSLQFAELVQSQFVGTLQRANRGVRQAAFWVLLKSACPSVLVEMGFLSNAEEEKWLASAEGKTGIVNGIFDAFQKFYTK